MTVRLLRRRGNKNRVMLWGFKLFTSTGKMCYDCHCVMLEYMVNDGDLALTLAASGGRRENCVACRLLDSSITGDLCNVVS